MSGGSDGSLPAAQGTSVQSLGREDPLEKEMATHSNTLAWKIPWVEEPGRLMCAGCLTHLGIPVFSCYLKRILLNLWGIGG